MLIYLFVWDRLALGMSFILIHVAPPPCCWQDTAPCLASVMLGIEFRGLDTLVTESHPSSSIKLLKDIFVLYIWMLCLHVCACTKCTPDARRDQKKALIPRGLELQMFGSHHVSAGNWSRVLCESSKYSKLLSHPSSPQIPIKLVLIIHGYEMTL